MTIHSNQLHINGIAAETLVAEFGSPLYVYDAECIRQRFHQFHSAFPYLNLDVHYACKANSNLAILRLLREEGACIDAVSTGEVFMALEAGYPAHAILFTGNNVTDEEMHFLLEHRILINIDSVSQLKRYGQMAPDTDMGLRINPNVGSGHHDYCITGGPDSKFGISHESLDEVRNILTQYQLRVTGVHAHVGSGFLDVAPFLEATETLLTVAGHFKALQFVDFGGGFGIPYAPAEVPLDINTLGQRLTDRFTEFCNEYGKGLRLKLEPGRYIVGESGVLLMRCNAVKSNGDRTFVGTDSGFHHLIRYPLYNAHHEIVNADNIQDQVFVYDVCGNICESTDFFARNRSISYIREGDILAVKDVGAYGFCMSSNYNTRPRPAEVLVDYGRARLIRVRETMEDLLRGQREF